MKLRILGNSVRVRLARREVRVLASGQPIEQTTVFSPSSKLVLSVESCLEAERAVAIFADHRLSLRLPLAEVRQWAETEQVGIEAQQPIGDGQSLHILIEKDFECLQPRAGDDTDAFPNPKRSRMI